MTIFGRAPNRQLPALCGLVAEAAAWLVLSRLAILIVPFRIIASFLDRPLLRSGPDLAERQLQVKRIQWAIERACRVLPGETVCFPRGMAGFFMCRLRGIDSVLHYGAAVIPGEGLKAHVWLCDGNYGVIGHRIAEQYRILARFPAGAKGN